MWATVVSVLQYGMSNKSIIQSLVPCALGTISCESCAERRKVKGIIGEDWIIEWKSAQECTEQSESLTVSILSARYDRVIVPFNREMISRGVIKPRNILDRVPLNGTLNWTN